MPWRDLLDDTARHHFLREFTSGPLTDRSSCLHRCFTGQGRNLAPLFRCELRRSSRSGRILQTLRYTERLKIDPLQSHPTIPPQADGIYVECQLTPNLGIGVPLRCCYDHTRTLRL